MKRSPSPSLPTSRAALPEGCSDLIDAYQIHSATREVRAKFLLRISAILHDSFVDQLDPKALRSQDRDDLLHRISDFLHPILLADLEFEKKVRPSYELVDMLYHVLIANLENDGE